MKEKQKIKVSLSTVLLIFTVLIIAVMAYFMYAQKKSSDEEIKQLQDKISSLQANTENNATTDNSEIKIVSDILDYDERLFPSIYIDENGYVYYNANFVYGKSEKEYKPICAQDNSKIKPNTIIVQSRSTLNEITPGTTTRYTFIADSKVYEFDYYFDSNTKREVFSDHAKIKYDTPISKYKFIEIKDEYGGHSIDMKLIDANKKEYDLIDIAIAYDLKTAKDLIYDSWHMDFDKEYDV